MMMDNNTSAQEEEEGQQPPPPAQTQTPSSSGGGGGAVMGPLQHEEELEWQDVAIEQETGLLASSHVQGQSQQGMGEEQEEGAKAPTQPKTGFAALCACFSVEFYQPYFDVNTMDVVRRMSRVFYPPRTPNFSELTAEKPDLYGPIWIGATLVFLLGAMSNFVQWAHFKPDDHASIWKYDFTLVTLAMVFVFSYMGLMAFFSWAFLRYIGVRLASVRSSFISLHTC
eukprot:gb/GECG01012072.1/.p1 GENE.gb/GECG01012072.1/~~gb/GECG01012072.1/.p1  ORF type:complete len:226 (+),score=28.95 gb/GECG01012072.1/:1-678(+)